MRDGRAAVARRHHTAPRSGRPGRRVPTRRGPTLGLRAMPAGPVPGYVLIADRNNNRMLIVSPRKRVVWSSNGLRGPDDAFFTPGCAR